MHPYRILKFDSGLFGFPVAQIAPRLDAGAIAPVLDELRLNGVRLAYWVIDQVAGDGLRRAANELGGKCVDEKTTFLLDLANIRPDGRTLNVAVEPFDPSMASAQLEALAVQAGEHSRFAVDPRVPRCKFIELYTLWIRKSVSRELADEVLVIRGGDDDITGMVTLGTRHGRGDIGLIAVDAACRGKGHGQALMHAAHQWFIARGLRFAQVVTQDANAPACSLYHKCGYSVEKIEPYYHFWL